MDMRSGHDTADDPSDNENLFSMLPDELLEVILIQNMDVVTVLQVVQLSRADKKFHDIWVKQVRSQIQPILNEFIENERKELEGLLTKLPKVVTYNSKNLNHKEVFDKITELLISAKNANYLRFIFTRKLQNYFDIVNDQTKLNDENIILDLSGVDLRGVDLSDMYLEYVKLEYANLRGQYLSGITLRYLKGADLRECDLTNILSGPAEVYLQDADLRGVWLNNSVVLSNRANKNTFHNLLMARSIAGCNISKKTCKENCYTDEEIKAFKTKLKNDTLIEIKSASLDEAITLLQNIIKDQFNPLKIETRWVEDYGRTATYKELLKEGVEVLINKLDGVKELSNTTLEKLKAIDREANPRSLFASEFSKRLDSIKPVQEPVQAKSVTRKRDL